MIGLQSKIITLIVFYAGLIGIENSVAQTAYARKQLPESLSRKLLVPEPLLTASYTSLKSGDSQQFLEAFANGDSLVNCGDFKNALKHYSAALTLAQQFSDQWLQALVLNRMGFINYWSLNFTASTEYYKQAAQLISSDTLQQDTLLAIETEIYGYLNNYKTSIKQVHQKDRFEQLLQSGFVFKGERQMKYDILLSLFALNEIQFGVLKNRIFTAEDYINTLPEAKFPWVFLANYLKIRYYIKTEEILLTQKYLTDFYRFIQNEPALKPYEYFIINDLVYVYNYLKDYQKEQAFVSKLENYTKERKSAYFYVDFLAIGDYYWRQGDPLKAEEYYTKSEKLLLSNHVNDDRLAFVYITKSYFYGNGLRDTARAISNLLHAENILNSYPNIQLETYVNYLLSFTYFNLCDYSNAIMRCNYVLSDLENILQDPERLISISFEQRSPYYLDLIIIRANSYRQLAYVNHNDTALLNKALANYQDALHVAKALFHKRGGEDSKANEIKILRRVINNLVDLNSEIFEITGEYSNITAMFNLSEKGKSFFTKDHLDDERAKKLAGIPEKDIAIGHKMQIEIDSLQYTLYNSDQKLSNRSNQILTGIILNKSEKLEDYNRDLEQKYPRFAQLRNTNDTINLPRLQSKLNASEAVLDYFYTKKRMYVFFMNSDTLLLHAEDIDSLFHNLIVEYRKLLERNQFGGFMRNELAHFDSLSEKLYTRLILPYEKGIKGKRLIIIPDKELVLIPFETLVKPTSASSELSGYARLNYLIKEHPISYLYASTQLLNEETELPKKIKYAGLSPNYDPASGPNNGVEQLLQPLPGAMEEVKKANNFFHGDLYLGNAANRKNFFKACKKSDILHLAMHTLIDKNTSMNSKMLFSSDYNNPSEYVRAYEVYSNPINASLVILSACNTGVGDYKAGEGLLSIANAFIRGGVQNVIYTQWSVSDQSSSLIMQSFYEFLSAGVPSDIALQQSKIDFLTKGDPLKAHPFYWAGYIQMGNSIQLKTKAIPLLIWIGLFSAILIVLMLILHKKKYTNRN